MNNTATLSYERPRFFTPWVWVISGLAALGLLSLFARFIFGLLGIIMKVMKKEKENE